MIAAALLSALAVLVGPASPRRRLTVAAGRRRQVGARSVGSLAVCVGAAGALLLPPPTLLAVAMLGATAGLRWRRRRRERRGAQEGAALETALDVLVGELRVGAHPVRAFGVAADETGGPVGLRLRAVAARARLGGDVAEGLRSSARSSVLPGQWDRLAVCWRLAEEHGLGIAALMRAAQCDIAERQRFSARLVSGMAGARATAAILAGLPLFGVALGQLIGARPIGFLLDGRLGSWVLAIGVALVCCGLLWSDRITDRVAA